MRKKLWTVISVIYMATLSLFSFIDAIAVIRITDGYIPLFGLIALLIVAGLFAALTAIALARKWQTARLWFWMFCLVWSLATYVDASVFIVMCITEIGWFISLAVATVIPTGLGFLLVRKASPVNAIEHL